MFEDATFDARGAVRNHTSQWMVLTATLNAAVVAGLVVAPLVYLHRLPNVLMTPRPLYAPQPVKLPEQTVEQRWTKPVTVLMPLNPGVGHITKNHDVPTPPEGCCADPIDISPNTGSNATPDGMAIFHGSGTQHVVREAAPAMMRVSGGVVEGLLLPHATPSYPQIAKAAGIGGDVVLAATISAEGRIEHLRVVGGHPMLRDAALEAVKGWRYRPYLLNGEAVEVETTITVRFTLGH